MTEFKAAIDVLVDKMNQLDQLIGHLDCDPPEDECDEKAIKKHEREYQEVVAALRALGWQPNNPLFSF